jgi:hypothetical protein
MFIPETYAVAFLLTILTMVRWRSWANTQNLCKGWRFELFYWDDVREILLITLLLGFTLGRTGADSKAKRLPAMMFAFSIVGMVCVALAPVVK